MNEVNWKDKQQVLNAVNKDGDYLQYASEELQSDKDVVLAAVKKNSYALKYASEQLKNNKEICLIAVKKKVNSLRYASKELQNDKEIILAAFDVSPVSLQFASKELQNDFEILKLLKNYHRNDKVNDAKYGKEYNTWYKERMNVLDILNEQELLSDSIPTNTGKAKTRKF